MKIGIISDTHGDQAAIQQVVKLVTDVDLWLHAGDYSQDAEYLSHLSGLPVFAARGNCDGYTTAKIDEFIDVLGKKIWMTHGHRYGVKQDTGELVYWGKQHGVDIVIYGHTHVADNRWCEGLLIFNPGSAYGRRATCGIIEIDDAGKVIGSIVKFDRSC